MARQLVSLILAWGLVLTAATAVRGDEDYSRSGAYAGIGGSFAIERFDANVSGVPIRADNKLGWNVRVGYRALSFLAGEVQLERFNDLDIKFAGFDSNLDLLALTGNLKLTYPTGPLQPFALAGGGYLWADPNNTGVSSGSREVDLVGRFGGGIDMYFTENIVGSLEGTYVVPFGDVEDLNYVALSWGLQYRF